MPLGWLSYPNVCLPTASCEYRKITAKRGSQFVLIGMQTVCWKTFPAKTTNMLLSTRNSSIFMMSFSEYLFIECSECSFAQYTSSCPHTEYSYLRLLFLIMKELRIIVVCFSISGEVKFAKNRKTWCFLHGSKLKI